MKPAKQIVRTTAFVALIALAVGTGCGNGAAEPAVPEGSEWPEALQRYMKLFNDGQLDTLHRLFSPELQADLTLPELTLLRRNLTKAYGREVAVISQDAKTRGDYRGFVRWARYERLEGIVQIQWILRADDTIAGFFVAAHEGQTVPLTDAP